MRISEDGAAQIARYEGSRRLAYLDVSGHPTIGVGHLLTAHELATGQILIAGKLISYRGGLSEDQEQALFRQDLARYEAPVNHLITAPLTQHQFDALVSLCFNIGTGGFSGSNIVKRLNAGDVPGAFRFWRQWIKTGGKVNRGLVARREKEIKYFLTPD